MMERNYILHKKEKLILSKKIQWADNKIPIKVKIFKETERYQVNTEKKKYMHLSSVQIVKLTETGFWCLNYRADFTSSIAQIFCLSKIELVAFYRFSWFVWSNALFSLYF